MTFPCVLRFLIKNTRKSQQKLMSFQCLLDWILKTRGLLGTKVCGSKVWGSKVLTGTEVLSNYIFSYLDNKRPGTKVWGTKVLRSFLMIWWRFESSLFQGFSASWKRYCDQAPLDSPTDQWTHRIWRVSSCQGPKVYEFYRNSKGDWEWNGSRDRFQQGNF